MTALPMFAPLRTPRPDSDAGPQLEVVARRGRLRVVWVVASLLVLVTAVLAAVTLNALAADDAVVAARLEGRMTAAEAAHGQLLTEVATLESPARIAAAAEELGLVRVDHPRQLRVSRLVSADGIVHGDDLVRRGGDLLKPLLAQD